MTFIAANADGSINKRYTTITPKNQRIAKQSSRTGKPLLKEGQAYIAVTVDDLAEVHDQRALNYERREFSKVLVGGGYEFQTCAICERGSAKSALRLAFLIEILESADYQKEITTLIDACRVIGITKMLEIDSALDMYQTTYPADIEATEGTTEFLGKIYIAEYPEEANDVPYLFDPLNQHIWFPMLKENYDGPTKGTAASTYDNVCTEFKV